MPNGNNIASAVMVGAFLCLKVKSLFCGKNKHYTALYIQHNVVPLLYRNNNQNLNDILTNMKLKNLVTGIEVVVRATTNHPQSSYGKAVWVDDDNTLYCQQGMEMASGYEIVNHRNRLGVKLQKIREEKGLNKNFFAKRGIRIETISSIEEGRSNYSIDKLFDYLDILGIELTIK